MDEDDEEEEEEDNDDDAEADEEAEGKYEEKDLGSITIHNITFCKTIFLFLILFHFMCTYIRRPLFEIFSISSNIHSSSMFYNVL